MGFLNNRVLEFIRMVIEAFSIPSRFKKCESDFSWVFTVVYGPLDRSSREAFWEELGMVRGLL